MDINHKIKRLLQFIAIKLIRLTTPKEDRKKGEYETECLSICTNLIHKENTKLLISPISKKRYIKNDDKRIFIIMESDQLTIVNHNYSYNINVLPKSYDRLTSLFDNEVEKRRQKMEDEIRSNVKHSLSNIYQNIINEKD
jgi:hypothetical protein